MRRKFLKIAAIALSMSSAAYGQSLGDVARENREKQDAKAASSTVKPKVITNQDLPKDPEADQGPSEAPPDASAPASNEAAERRSEQQRLTQQRTAVEWKRQIVAQKNKVANLQARIDQLHASIQAATGSVQYEGPISWYQARQLQRVEQIQQQLDVQKRKLDQMQEGARRAGMHSAVYDP